MPLFTSIIVSIALLNWVGISLLVAFDAYNRGVRKYWQWGLVSLLLGLFGFVVYVLFIVSPPER